MTHEEMLEYLQNTPIRDIVPPLIYQQYFKHNIYTKGWTGIELGVAIAQNNAIGYQLLLPEVQKVTEDDERIIFHTDYGDLPVNMTLDDNMLSIMQYKKHAQIAVVKIEDPEQYFVIATSAPTEKEARKALNIMICQDVIRAFNIKTPGRFKNLYSESMVIFRKNF